MKTLRTFPGQRVALGHQGENLALTVIFNIGAWADAYGPGTVHLVHMRNGGPEAYPVAVTQEGTEVSWEVSDADTAVDGYGKYELRYIVGETVVKSSVGETYVRKALQNGAEPPEPVQSWVDHMTEKEHELLEAVGEAKEASEKAAGAAGDALTFANAAAQAAGSAEEAARNAALAAQNVSDLADNARLSAKAAADQAGQAAGSAKEAKDAVEEARKIVDGADVVKSVNGQTPDENGNVRIEVGSGSGVDVTAKPGQLIRVQSVDENGKPTAWEPVPWGYTEGGIVEILPECQPVSEGGGFALDGVPFTLTEGEVYTVNWNGVEYKSTARNGSIVASSNPILVNDGANLETGEGAVFIITYASRMFIQPFDGTTELTLSVYQGDIVHHPIPGELLPEGVPYVEKRMVEIPVAYEWLDNSGATITAPIGLKAGNTYTVVWDGVEYVVTAREEEMEGLPAIVLGNTTGETSEAFMLAELPAEAAIEMGFYGMAVDVTGGAYKDFSIYRNAEIIHPIPGKLLPEGVPYVEKGVILEETDAREFADPTFGKSWIIEKTPSLTVGETYTVIYNGAPYDCVCHPGESIGMGFAEGGFLLGNFSVVGGENTGEPFAMVISPAVQGIACIDLSGATSVRIGIMGKVGHKIDPRCLPVLTVTVDTSSMTADKTHDEIYTAVKAGRTVLLFYGNNIGSFVSASTFDACFVVTTTSLGTSGVADVIKTFVIVHESGEVFTFEE